MPYSRVTSAAQLLVSTTTMDIMRIATRFISLVASASVIALSGCGSGASSSGSGAGTAGQTVSAASVMAGTVAVGAPMLNATVTILGASGQSVSASADAVNGTLSESGSELAIVLRKGTSTWALLGEENPCGITVGAAVERTLSVNAAQPQPTYTRNIAIDIPTSVPSGVMAPHAAKVYVHDNAGDGGWDTSAPIATLSDSGCTGQQSLTITGNVCGGEWLSLDSFNSSDLHAGDAFIDALYRRGRDL